MTPLAVILGIATGPLPSIFRLVVDLPPLKSVLGA